MPSNPILQIEWPPAGSEGLRGERDERRGEKKGEKDTRLCLQKYQEELAYVLPYE